ncbi:Fic family protein, partial [Salmonella enterica subsp. enterica serovar Infantis]
MTISDELLQYADREVLADPVNIDALRYSTAMYEGLKHIGKYPLCTSKAASFCTTIRGVYTYFRISPVSVLRD